MKARLRLAASPLRNIYLKYLSEVGYLRRDFNWQLSHLLERNDISRRQLLAARIRLDSQDAELVSAIRSDGHAKTRVDAFCPESTLLPYLRSVAADFGTPGLEEIAKSRTGSSKYYWKNVWEPPAHGSDPLLDFACNHRILSVVSKYLEQIPLLQDISFFYSPANHGSIAAPVGSQGWHLDNDQKTRLKIFLSPFRITRRSGPTTCLPLAYSKARMYRNFPGYFDDEQAEAFGLETARKVEMLAEPGEFHFADTSRLFHFGSRDVQDPRWLAIISYGPKEYYLNQASRRKLSGPESRYHQVNKRILESLASPADKN